MDHDMMMDEDEEDAKPAAKPSPKADGTISTTTTEDADSTTAADPQGESEQQQQLQPVTGELAFLVTHWLSGYRANLPAAADLTEEQAAAWQKIQYATQELSSAFATLGAFGSAPKVRNFSY